MGKSYHALVETWFAVEMVLTSLCPWDTLICCVVQFHVLWKLVIALKALLVLQYQHFISLHYDPIIIWGSTDFNRWVTFSFDL